MNNSVNTHVSESQQTFDESSSEYNFRSINAIILFDIRVVIKKESRTLTDGQHISRRYAWINEIQP